MGFLSCYIPSQSEISLHGFNGLRACLVVFGIRVCTLQMNWLFLKLGGKLFRHISRRAELDWTLCPLSKPELTGLSFNGLFYSQKFGWGFLLVEFPPLPRHLRSQKWDRMRYKTFLKMFINKLLEIWFLLWPLCWYQISERWLKICFSQCNRYTALVLL